MDELPPDARALLAAANGGEDPDPRSRARMHAAFSARLAALGVAAPPPPLAEAGGPAVGGTGAGAAKLGSAKFGSAKLALAVTTVVLGGGLGLWFGARPPAPTSPSTRSPVVAPAAPSTATADVPAARGPAQEATRTATGVQPSTPKAPAQGSAAKHRHPRRRHARPAEREGGLARELRLVGAARQALLENDTGRARTLLSEHARSFPSGVLQEEREGLWVLALCEAGATARARAARARFLARWPGSVLVKQVRAVCGKE